MPYLELDQNRYYYAGDLKKEGIPITFCHGSGGGHHHWLYQVSGLKKPANPLAVDLPGHGRSAGEPSNTVAAYRDWLHAYAAAAGIVPFVPAGHSLGGAIALDYALHYPEEIRGLILVGTGGRLKVLPAFLECLEQGAVPGQFCDFLYGPHTAEEMLEKGREEVLNNDPSIYYADLSACNNFDVMDRLHEIQCPCLIICGSDDQLTPPRYSHFMQERLHQSEVVLIEGAGHMVMLEKPDQVNEAITKFIKSL